MGEVLLLYLIYLSYYQYYAIMLTERQKLKNEKVKE